MQDATSLSPAVRRARRREPCPRGLSRRVPATPRRRARPSRRRRHDRARRQHGAPAASKPRRPRHLHRGRGQGHRQADDQPVGGRPGERRRRPVPAPADGLQGHDQHPRRGGRLAGLRHRRGRRHPRELGPPRSREDLHHRQEGRPGRRPERRRRDHRLVCPRLDDRQVPRHHRLEQPEQVRRPVQDLRVGRQGPVPRQRPDVRPVRRGADHEPEAQLQGRLLGQRGGHHHRVPEGRQGQDAADRLLLRPAVAAVGDQARPGQAAAVHHRLRRGPQGGRLRLPAVHAQQDRRHEVRRDGWGRLHVHQELQVDERRPEQGRG